MGILASCAAFVAARGSGAARPATRIDGSIVSQPISIALASVRLRLGLADRRGRHDRVVTDLDRLMDLTRASVRQLAAAAGEHMLAGADASRTHKRYVVPALALLEEAEAHAVLVAGGDAGALAEIERIIGELDGLNRDLEEEYPP